MQKTYCVLWGTHLVDFENEESSKHSTCPRSVLELIGVSEWTQDNGGNSFVQQFEHNFLVVTHTGGTYYMSTNSAEERENWMLHIKTALECMFANQAVVGFKPTKHFQNKPVVGDAITSGAPQVCAKTGTALAATHSIYCVSCGRPFQSADHLQELSTIVQIQIEDAVKVCADCRDAQCCLVWMKNLCYVHIMALHELTPSVNTEVFKFKSSFRLRRRSSQRLDMAAQLLEQGNINLREFEELRRVDYEYRQESSTCEGDRIAQTLDILGSDMQTMISLLMSSPADDACSRLSYCQVVTKILSLADSEPELVEFYFPQLVHVHFLESKHCTLSGMVKVDLLQQALLAISAKYHVLGLQLAWSLLGHIGDYQERRIATAQYSAAVCLLLQLELQMCGSCSSLLCSEEQALLKAEQDLRLFGDGADPGVILSAGDGDGRDSPVPPQRVLDGAALSVHSPRFCRQLALAFRPAVHQTEALLFDMDVVLRARYRLYDIEARFRHTRDLRQKQTPGVFMAIAEKSLSPSPPADGDGEADADDASVYPETTRASLFRPGTDTLSPTVAAAAAAAATASPGPGRSPGSDPSAKWYPGKYIGAKPPHVPGQPRGAGQPHPPSILAKVSPVLADDIIEASPEASDDESLSVPPPLPTCPPPALPPVLPPDSTATPDLDSTATATVESESEPVSTPEPEPESEAVSGSPPRVPDTPLSVATPLRDHMETDCSDTDTDTGSSADGEDTRDSGFGDDCHYALNVTKLPPDDTGSGRRARTGTASSVESLSCSVGISTRPSASGSAVEVAPGSCLSYLLALGAFFEDADRQRKNEIIRRSDSESATPIAKVELPLHITLHNRSKDPRRFFLWHAFGDQLDFMWFITEMVETLRFVDRPLRTARLKEEIDRLTGGLLGGILQCGFDPTSAPTEPKYRIVGMDPAECRVFRTKARAPSMLVCVVKRDDEEELVSARTAARLCERERDLRSIGGSPATPQVAGEHDRLRSRSCSQDGRNCTSPSITGSFVSHVQVPFGRGRGQSQCETDVREVMRDLNSLAVGKNGALSPAHSRSGSISGVGGPEVVSPPGQEEAPVGGEAAKGETAAVNTTDPNPEPSPGTLVDVLDRVMDESLVEQTLANLRASGDEQNRLGQHPQQQPQEQPPAPKQNSASASASPLPSSALPRTGMIERQASSFLSTNRKGGLFRENHQMTITEFLTTLEPDVVAGRPVMQVKIMPPSPAPGAEAGGAVPEPLVSPGVALPPTPMVRSSEGEGKGEGGGSNGAVFFAVDTETIPAGAAGAFSPAPPADGGSSVSSSSGSSRDGAGVRPSVVTPELPEGAPSVAVSFVEGSAQGLDQSFRRASLVQARALQLLESNRIDEGEYYKLVDGDLEFRDSQVREEALTATRLVEDAFGELWARKKARLLGNKVGKNQADYQRRQAEAEAEAEAGPDADADADAPRLAAALLPLYDVRAFIVKSNDDLRQEVCCLQVMTLCREIFHDMGISKQLWLKPYKILSTGECVVLCCVVFLMF